jgi:hypothetical protein
MGVGTIATEGGRVIVPHPDYRFGYVVGIGPAAEYGRICSCGRLAVAACQACAGAFCVPCWWRHSHTSESKLKQPAGACAPRQSVGVAITAHSMARAALQKCDGRF